MISSEVGSWLLILAISTSLDKNIFSAIVEQASRVETEDSVKVRTSYTTVIIYNHEDKDICEFKIYDRTSKVEVVYINV